MREFVMIGTKEFKNGRWVYKMDEDDNVYIDEKAFQSQRSLKPETYTPVYICYDYPSNSTKPVAKMYDREDLWRICDMDSELTEYIFSNLKGELPEDLLEEYKLNKRVVKCPRCGKYIFLEDF